MTDQQAQQKGETLKAHTAYLDYRDMGIARSLKKLVATYLAHTSPTACPTTRLGTLESWSSKFNWQERIADYDQSLQTAKETAEAEARLKERDHRKKILKKLRKLIEDQTVYASLASDEGIKAFAALTRAIKSYMELSMKQYNDLPVKQEEVTSKSININFNTEPIPENIVNDRLKSLGLLQLVEDQTE